MLGIRLPALENWIVLGTIVPDDIAVTGLHSQPDMPY